LSSDFCKSCNGPQAFPVGRLIGAGKTDWTKNGCRQRFGDFEAFKLSSGEEEAPALLKKILEAG
jgi:hypothetical protein